MQSLYTALACKGGRQLSLLSLELTGWWDHPEFALALVTATPCVEWDAPSRALWHSVFWDV